jgi:RNA polymerase sigma factor (sigma-70 family)
LFSFAAVLLNNLKNTKMTLQEFNHRILNLNDSLRNYAMSLASNQEDVNDLLQDTYLKALTNREKFDPSTNMKAWTYTIMKNTFINNYRKLRRTNTIMDDSKETYLLNNNQKLASIDTESQYFHGEIMQAIRQLDEEQRIPFEKHIEGLKYKEIAEVMDLPIGTVKSRIFLTRQKLSQNLKEFRN